MNFRAQSTFKPADLSRLMQRIVPQLVAAVQEGCAAVVEEAEAIVPVDSGDLKDSIHIKSVELVGNSVNGNVVADAGYAGFVEFGTGLRGVGTYPYPLPTSGVPITGSWVYDYKQQKWIGHEARPFMRPALDSAQPAIRSAFARRGFKVS